MIVTHAQVSLRSGPCPGSGTALKTGAARHAAQQAAADVAAKGRWWPVNHT